MRFRPLGVRFPGGRLGHLGGGGRGGRRRARAASHAGGVAGARDRREGRRREQEQGEEKGPAHHCSSFKAGRNCCSRSFISSACSVESLRILVEPVLLAGPGHVVEPHVGPQDQLVEVLANLPEGPVGELPDRPPGVELRLAELR